MQSTAWCTQISLCYNYKKLEIIDQFSAIMTHTTIHLYFCISCNRLISLCVISVVGTDPNPISRHLDVFAFVRGDHLQKRPTLTISNRIGIKFGRTFQVNTNRLVWPEFWHHTSNTALWCPFHADKCYHTITVSAAYAALPTSNSTYSF